MAGQEGDQDRSEQATPYKLEQARKSGSVPKSTEVNVAFSLFVGVLAAAASSDWASLRLLHLEQALFNSSGRWVFDVPHLIARLHTIGEAALFILSPLFALLVIGAVLSNLGQSGAVFSPGLLSPDFSRINPATGFKRLFSVKAVFEALKSVLKLVLVTIVAYYSIKSILPILQSLYIAPEGQVPVVFQHYTFKLLRDLLIAIVAIAVADLVFVRWEFGKRMRMSRRDLKEEVKRREGDPKVKSRRRELMREYRKRATSARDVKGSDVLITNPTHYAVAVKYRRKERPAPEIVAKGTGHLALHMRQLAFESGVPIVPSPRLARELFETVPLGSMIRPEQYEIVASLLKWAYERRPRAGDASR